MPDLTSGPAPLERKLYQLVIPRLEGDRITDPRYREEVQDLVRRGIGGFILFGGTVDDLPGFLDSLQSLSGVPLFIASDIERGVAQQVRGMTSFPCPMAFAAAIDRNDPEDLRLVTSCVRAVATEARHIGINMPLLPVLDVNRNPDNPIICTRAFSDQPEEVAWFGETFVRVLESEGMVSCAKHFPGHGDTAVDSHLSLPVIGKTLEDLQREDLPPFERAVEAGVSCVMVGHLAVPCLDERPASLSKKVIGGLLRKDLGFDGLVVTDALNMGGLAGISDIAVAAVDAGADLLLHPPDPHTTVRELLAAVESGRLTEERIDWSLGRILARKRTLAQARHGAIPPDSHRHRLLASAVTERSVTFVKAAQGLLPLRDTGSTAVVCAGDPDLRRSSLIARSSPAVLSPESAAESLATQPERVVIIAVFTSVVAWKGSSGIGEADHQAILRLIASPARTIIVSFGSPYVLRHFAEAHALIAAYEPTEAAQTAVLRALRGEAPFRGRLPVTLHGG